MIKVNERSIPFEKGLSLFELRRRIKPAADLCIYNGFPVEDDRPIHDGDEVVLIKKGEVPREEELEALMSARHSPRIAEKLKRAKVGIAGLGGLGSAVAIALARTGVGTLVLVDFDSVEPSNLNRQHYFIHQLGEKKVTALQNTLKAINPYVTLEVHCTRLNEHNTPLIYQDTEILVEAFDRAESKAMLANVFLTAYPQRYLVSVSGIAGFGNANAIQTRTYGHLFLIGDGISAAEPGNGLMAPRVGVAAHHQANKVIELILEGQT